MIYVKSIVCHNTVKKKKKYEKVTARVKKGKIRAEILKTEYKKNS